MKNTRKIRKISNGYIAMMVTHCLETNVVIDK